MWVFAYGSLMWNPGFDFIESSRARLFGYHRALCIHSWVWRGTPDRPGLVLGLDHGGSCLGMAYRVAEEKASDVVEYLRAREQVTMVYQERWATIKLATGTDPRVPAIVYTVDRQHEQYAGRQPIGDLVDIAKSAHGRAGSTADYIISTAAHLEEMGAHDPQLSALAAILQQD